jgi:hypothetical protein
MPIELAQLERMIGNPRPGPIPPFCVNCGYNLTGAVSPRCPECGAYFSPKEWKVKAREALQRVQDIKDANQWARWGMWITAGGAGLLLIGLLMPGSCLALFGLVPAMLAGLMGLSMGIGVLRVPPLPHWVSDELAPQRDYPLALSGMILGGSIMAGAIVALLNS